MSTKESSYMPKSKSDTHITPDRVWQLIQLYWGYTKNQFFDPCPVDWKESGLVIDWSILNYVNPPYTLLGQFVAKAVAEAVHNENITVMLLPAKTDQDWFHDYIIQKGYEIKWINKRLKFKNNKWSATQPHFLVLVK